MKPGIYYDVSWDDYRAIDAMNPSLLKHGVRSMKRLRRAIEGECDPDPKTVAIGSAVHCLVAGEFSERYAILPKFELDEANVTANGKSSTSKATSYYKKSVVDWRPDDGKELITEVQYNTAQKVATEVSKRAAGMVSSSLQEVCIVGEIQGVPMKTRIDGLCDGHGYAWDLKTTSDISDEAFYRIYKKLNYGFSFAVHYELLRQNGIILEGYKIIAAEVGGDYDVRIIHVPMQAIDCHFDSVERTAKAYRIAKEADVWPGLEDAPLHIPDWDMTEEPELEWRA